MVEEGLHDLSRFGLQQAAQFTRSGQEPERISDIETLDRNPMFRQTVDQSAIGLLRKGLE